MGNNEVRDDVDCKELLLPAPAPPRMDQIDGGRDERVGTPCRAKTDATRTVLGGAAYRLVLSFSTEAKAEGIGTEATKPSLGATKALGATTMLAWRGFAMVCMAGEQMMPAIRFVPFFDDSYQKLSKSAIIGHKIQSQNYPYFDLA